jgi:hypothetical protein
VIRGIQEENKDGKMRKHYDAKFKAEVASSALQEGKTEGERL